MTTEAEFLESYSADAYERPSVAVDVALITVVENELRVLLVERHRHPYSGSWQLPGGFVLIDESVEAAARRALAEKTGIKDVFVEQLYTFGDPGRDPRTRVISVAYYALIDAGRLRDRSPGSLLARIDVPWPGESGGPVAVADAGDVLPVAFDHEDIVGMVVKRLRGKLRYSPVGYELLPAAFTLLDLQRIHETILGVPLNKDSFRRRMLASGELEATGERQTNVGHRPAALYRRSPSG